MNEKTAKLLRKYSDAKGINLKEMKRKWLTLNQKEKFLERQRILNELKQIQSK